MKCSITYGNWWSTFDVSDLMRKISAKLSKLLSTCPTGQFETKFFLEKSVIFISFGFSITKKPKFWRNKYGSFAKKASSSADEIIEEYCFIWKAIISITYRLSCLNFLDFGEKFQQVTHKIIHRVQRKQILKTSFFGEKCFFSKGFSEFE